MPLSRILILADGDFTPLTSKTANSVIRYLPDRTVGMDYLMLREFLLPLGDWVGQLQATRNACAQAHQVPVRADTFIWNEKRNGSINPK